MYGMRPIIAGFTSYLTRRWTGIYLLYTHTYISISYKMTNETFFFKWQNYQPCITITLTSKGLYSKWDLYMLVPSI